MMIRVLILDHHEILRAGIRSICDPCDDLGFVGETAFIDDAIEILRRNEVDVAIIDPDCLPNGLNQIESLRHEFPNLKMLVFSSTDDVQEARACLDFGANGYLVKIAGLDELLVAIRVISQGRRIVSHSPPDSEISARPDQRDATRNPSGHGNAVRVDASHLSARESEVLRLLADGLTNKQIAEALFLSVKTVETYRARIMKKHDLRDRSELVKLARNMQIAS